MQMDVVLSSLQDNIHVSTLLNFRIKLATVSPNQFRLASDLVLVLLKNIHFFAVSNINFCWKIIF